MKRKYVARLILLLLFIGMCGCIAGVIKLMQGPEVVIEEGWFIQRKHEFKFKIPSGWIITKAPDENAAQYLLRPYGFTKTINAADYLPTIALQYGESQAQGKAGILYALNTDYSSIKSDSGYYRNLKLDDKKVRTHPRFSAVGLLSYGYTGIYENQRQITEIRYYVKGDLLITFMLADFEGRFNNRVLNELEETLYFEV